MLKWFPFPGRVLCLYDGPHDTGVRIRTAFVQTHFASNTGTAAYGTVVEAQVAAEKAYRAPKA